MKRFVLASLLVACHADAPNPVTIPSATASSPQPVVPASAAASASSSSSSGSGAAVVAFDVPTHFKSGETARAGDVSFTVRMLPKLIVSGPQPEIEQAQIDVARGADHTTLQVDTRHKHVEWSGVAFDFGYADVYHDDIELTIHRK